MQVSMLEERAGINVGRINVQVSMLEGLYYA